MTKIGFIVLIIVDIAFICACIKEPTRTCCTYLALQFNRAKNAIGSTYRKLPHCASLAKVFMSHCGVVWRDGQLFGNAVFSAAVRAHCECARESFPRRCHYGAPEIWRRTKRGGVRLI